MRNKSTSFLILFFIQFFLVGNLKAAIIVDHTAVRDFESIPAYWIEEAKKMTIHYAHTSHGSQLNTGADYLENYVSSNYRFTRRNATTEGLPAVENPIALRMYDGNPPETYIEPGDYWDTNVASNALDRTRAVVGTGRYNISMWSWCGQQTSNDVATVQRYLDNMKGLQTQFPDVTFVLMTGHTQGINQNDPTRTLTRNNQMVRDFANANGMVLYDFADIESWDPNGNFYPLTSDNCSWCATWCSNHPEDCQNLPITDSGCAHTHGYNCKLKGKAFWYMMARIAGWDGEVQFDATVPSTPSGLRIN